MEGVWGLYSKKKIKAVTRNSKLGWSKTEHNFCAIEHRRQVVSIPALYSGGPGSKCDRNRDHCQIMENVVAIFTLKMVAIHLSEWPITVFKTTRSHNPADYNWQLWNFGFHERNLTCDYQLLKNHYAQLVMFGPNIVFNTVINTWTCFFSEACDCW